MLDLQFGAQTVELVVLGRIALAQVEQPICEHLVVSEEVCGFHPGSTIKAPSEAAGVGCCLHGVDADKDPAGSTVDRHERIPAPLLVHHLWQVIHVDTQVVALVGLERLVRRPQCLGLQVLQPGHAIPTQAPVEARARDVRVQGLAHHC